MIDYVSEARQLRPLVEKSAQSLSEKDASMAPELMPSMHEDGSLILADTMIQFNGTVYRAGSDLWDTPENAPDKAPTLWKELKYKQGIRIIPDHISTTEKFSKDEPGWWKDEIYISLQDSNTFTPEQYPPFWAKKES